MQQGCDRALVITIRAGSGMLTSKEIRLLSDQIRQAVNTDQYAISVREVEGEQVVWVNSKVNRKKEEHLEAICRMQGEMTSQEIAKALGLTDRQVYRYKAMLKALSCGDAANDPK